MLAALRETADTLLLHAGGNEHSRPVSLAAHKVDKRNVAENRCIHMITALFGSMERESGLVIR